jgi:VIT1/CCC1 family predicted Fe2+/Mn2+ transporter
MPATNSGSLPDAQGAADSGCVYLSGQLRRWRGAMPLPSAAIVPASSLILLVSGISLVFFAIVGGVAARVGGAPVTTGAVRVTFWGALAMGLTAGVGALFGTLA